MSGDRIAVGADHGGYALKEHLKGWLEKHGYQVVDCGTHDGSRCDYPVVAAAVAERVSTGACARGVMVDGAGIGSAMMANKLPGVRASLCYDVSTARNAREHNDANVLTLGARLIGEGLAEQILQIWLETACTEPRHLKRVAMIGDIAKQHAACAACAPAKDYTLASASARHHSASPDPGFQARAAGWLMSRREMNRATMDSVDNLSAADLDRVATRIAQLLASGEQRGSLWCFGDVCIDARAARPWIDAGVARLSNGLGNGEAVRDVASYIDHTALKPDTTQSQIEQLCDEAKEYGFASVCVNPTWIQLCARRLGGTRVKVCTVVGFPLGANHRDIKAAETRKAIRDGAREIDMVINIGALKSGDDELVFKDIRAVVDACEDGRSICKVIIETALLTDEEKVRACVAAKKARADFVKTSTGFASGGATAADVSLMARVVQGTRMGVKASGGVRSLADLDEMVRAGATRIGASAGVKIMKEVGR
jgi:deoxyribose-phosphate aldolase